MNKLIRKNSTILALLCMILYTLTACAEDEALKLSNTFEQYLAEDVPLYMHYVNLEPEAGWDVVEMWKDGKGNMQANVLWKDGETEEFYKIGNDYYYYYLGEPEYITEEDALDNLSYVEELLSYQFTFSQGVFDSSIDVTFSSQKEPPAYVASGEYEEGGFYQFLYGKDGSFFQVIDDYDKILVQFNQDITIALP